MEYSCKNETTFYGKKRENFLFLCSLFILTSFNVAIHYFHADREIPSLFFTTTVTFNIGL